MAFFTSKRMSGHEFEKMIEHLHASGFSDSDRDNVKKVLSGSLGEEGLQRGIDRKEAERSVKWFREHKSQHSLSDNQIDKLEEGLFGKT